jgi:hypothetical protein
MKLSTCDAPGVKAIEAGGFAHSPVVARDVTGIDGEDRRTASRRLVEMVGKDELYDDAVALSVGLRRSWALVSARSPVSAVHFATCAARLMT